MLNFKLNRKLHRWLSLFVGIQILIWLSTGLYFNLMDGQKASGNEFRTRVNHLPAEHSSDKHSSDEHSNVQLIPISSLSLTNLTGHSPIGIKLTWILAKPYYHLIYQQNPHSYQLQSSKLLDAQTGEDASVNAAQIKVIAELSYTGNGKLSKPQLKQPPFDDYPQQQNPMWQVTANDSLNTAIYLHNTTGKVIRHSNDDKRLKDLMMKLHFMDYTNTGGFNNWLIIIFAIATFVLSITGVIWVVKVLNR